MRNINQFSAKWVNGAYRIEVEFTNVAGERILHTTSFKSKRKAIRRCRKAMRAFGVISPV